jgi:hypothetical protein
MKLYYKIWVDTLVRVKAQPQNKGRWKTLSFVFISIAMALNFITIISILQRNVLGATFYNLEIDVFPGTKLDALLKFVILFLLPVVIVNYLFIFHNKKYEMLIEKYKTHNGKLGITYLLLSYFLPLILLVLAYLIQNML